ncbi:MAG: hypothetical protein ACK5H4_21395 [Lacrimispora sphenoides]
MPFFVRSHNYTFIHRNNISGYIVRSKRTYFSAPGYTLGDQGFPGSETDNAKYYFERTKEEAQASSQNAQLAADVLTTTNKANAAAASEQVATQKAAAAGIAR